MKTLKRINKCFITLFFVVLTSATGLSIFAQESGRIQLTNKTFSEKTDLNRAAKRELGENYSVADWNDLKSIRNINEWIADVHLRNGWTFMLTFNGKLSYSGNRQYFVHYSTTGAPPSGFLVHDKIANKLFLGSWFDLNAQILAIRTDNDRNNNPGIRRGGNNRDDDMPGTRRSSDNREYDMPGLRRGSDDREYDNSRTRRSSDDRDNDNSRRRRSDPYYCGDLALSSETYLETMNLDRAIEREFGGNSFIADWSDLKSIRNINTWIDCMNLRKGQTFMVTRNRAYKSSGRRQYFVLYAPSGPPNGFLVHDIIGNKLFLGSWYGEERNILVKTRQ
jgi:hypothetical protein